MSATGTATRSAVDIARALGRPLPTEEQALVIEAPLEPGLVVAGAGSGKTETMAARVLWLVVNGLVRPDEVLGLTFTRKAAAELGERIRRRLVQLRAHDLVDDELAAAGDATVSTYDAYAGRLVAEHALRLGEEPSRRLVTEAVVWQHAARVAEAHSGDMSEVDHVLSTVIERVLALHGELAGHLVDPGDLVTETERFCAAVAAVPDAAGKRGPYAEVAGALQRQRARLQLLPVVEAFRAELRRAEVLDFATQAALGATLAQRFPEIGEAERERYRVVLLDEYQDTSVSQLVMLRQLFRGAAVTAVGDPCQSIYGWRGASAQTLGGFATVFGARSAAAAPVRSLSTSFRNRAGILRCANVLADGLRAAAPAAATVPVLRPATPAPDRVVVALHETVDDEAADLAHRIGEEWRAGADLPVARRPTIAVLVRKRAQIERIVTALRAAGVPVQVLGVGGLLLAPEVADVVATLQVLADPRRGDALVRLLTGPRWRIGPRDLDALGRWARHLVRLRRGEPPDEGAVDVEPDDVDERSIVDALDALPARGAAGPARFSAAGRVRLTALAAELRRLRARVAQPLPDLVGEVVSALALDVEVGALGPDARGRADLDAFLDVAHRFADSGEEANLPAFLAYLAAAETEERGLAPGEVEVSADAVQVLTVHGAKGLESDVVCVPGLVEGTFPAAGERDRAWLQDLGALPYALRGDAAVLPQLRVAGSADQKAVANAVDEHALACGELARTEERRLAYVAVTRARRHLVCSGARWGTGVRPLEPAPYLVELREACLAGAGEVAGWADPPQPGAVNPASLVPARGEWPYDPLGARRAAVEAGAAAVRAAVAELADPALGQLSLWDADGPAAARWDRDVTLLLAERARANAGNAREVTLPPRLAVSQLVLLARDPDALARSVRRPLPAAPDPLARRGTAFHAWLEGRWGAPRLVDELELPGAADEGAAGADELAALQQAFLASPWAQRTPVEVEAPFELVVDGLLLRGRADAVFAGPGTLEVVDWKTGAPPRDAADLAARSVQLAVYRLAWSRLRELPLDRVRAAFHHVREGLTIAPVDLLDEAGLVDLLRSVPEQG